MKFNDAFKLLNGDEVTVKETREVVKVINTSVFGPEDGLKRKTVFIETTSKTGHWQEYMHTEVK